MESEAPVDVAVVGASDEAVVVGVVVVGAAVVALADEVVAAEVGADDDPALALEPDEQPVRASAATTLTAAPGMSR